jgi:hypothetical protein
MPTTVACTCAALGSAGKLITESTGSAPRTFSSASLQHEFIYESLATKRPIASTNSITGGLAKMKSSVRNGSYLTQGAIAVQASPKELRRWLPRIFGGISGSNVVLSNNLPTFDVLVYRENGIFHYTDCMVAQAVLRGKTSSGGDKVEFMDFIVQLVGKQELIDITAWPATDPTMGVTADFLPYTFDESSATLAAVAVEYEKIDLIINNNLDVKFFNKPYPSCVRMTNREIRLDIQAAFTCDNLDTALAANTAAIAGTFSLATTGMSTVFSFPNLRNTFESPTIPGNTTFPQKFSLEAYASAADGINVTITQDDTP